MAVWVVRGGSRLGLHEEEFLASDSIGIYFGSDHNIADSTEGEIKRDVQDFYLWYLNERGKKVAPSSIKGVATKFTNQLLLFRDGIELGDTILMPRKGSGGRMVAVGEITSDYDYWDVENYPHRRQVRWKQESVPGESLPYEWGKTNQQTIIKVG